MIIACDKASVVVVKYSWLSQSAYSDFLIIRMTLLQCFSAALFFSFKHISATSVFPLSFAALVSHKYISSVYMMNDITLFIGNIQTKHADRQGGMGAETYNEKRSFHNQQFQMM